MILPLLVKIELSVQAVEEARELATARDAHNAARGWRYRHNGMPSVQAHFVGRLGEIAVESWLRAAGAVFRSAPTLVSDRALIEPDITFTDGCTLGVKTAQIRLASDLRSHGSFLYPARPPNSKRILACPDFVIQVGATIDGVVWLGGVAAREVIQASPTREIHGELAHQVALDKWARPESWLDLLLTARRNY